MYGLLHVQTSLLHRVGGATYNIGVVGGVTGLI